MRFLRFFILVFIILTGVVTTIFYSFNGFDQVDDSFGVACAQVAGLAGPEDIQVDKVRGRAFISSLDRRDANARGGIHLFDPLNPLTSAGWRDLTMGTPENFQPLGMDYYRDDEVERLFVVNQANAAVEMFGVAADGGLIHLETFSNARMTSPNNVVAVGRRSFYVTNDVKPGRMSWLAEAHFTFRIPSGEVIFMDGIDWRVVADGLRFANGLALSAEGDRLYVSETAGGAVRVFKRDIKTGDLASDDKIRLDFSPDNLTIDEAGDLWIAGLPKPLTLPHHRADSSALAPSEILRYRDGEGAKTSYRDDGSMLSAASVAARFGEKVLIGAIYEEKFLICDLPERQI